MLRKRWIDNQSGLTLAEVTVTLGLLAVVLVAGYNFYFSGLNLFASGEMRSEVQQAVRMSGDFIAGEIRNATELEIFNAGDAAKYTDTSYYYIYQDGAAIRYRRPGSTTGTVLFNGIYGNLTFQLDFRKTPGNLITYSVQASNSQQISYSITTGILLLNIETAGGINSGQAIRFKKPGV